MSMTRKVLRKIDLTPAGMMVASNTQESTPFDQALYAFLAKRERLY